jgi:hypothetical protein
MRNLRKYYYKQTHTERQLKRHHKTRCHLPRPIRCLLLCYVYDIHQDCQVRKLGIILEADPRKQSTPDERQLTRFNKANSMKRMLGRERGSG